MTLRVQAGSCNTVQFMYRNCVSKTETCNEVQNIARVPFASPFIESVQTAAFAPKWRRTASGVIHLKIYCCVYSMLIEQE